MRLVGVSVGARWTQTVLILEASVESRFVLQWTVESTPTVVVTVFVSKTSVSNVGTSMTAEATTSL